MAELTLNNSSKRSKKSFVKVSQTYVIKKTEPKVQTIQISCSEKKASPSTEQLLLTLMEEVKGIKDHIKIPSVTSLSDEYSRYTWVFCLKKKNDVADYIISFIKEMENLNEVRVKELRSDNGT
ncbi:retrovirus-related pol polyprotein from transposon TNT 1-94 [Tanacetum coccineum]